MNRVQQEDTDGCGVACLATLGGVDYATVRRDFPELPSGGLSEVQMLHWLNERGWWYRRWWVQAPVEPLASMALALVKEGKGGHWVVIVDGAVLDPARNPAPPLASYAVFKWIELQRPHAEIAWGW